jgi:hypothetical protein
MPVQYVQVNGYGLDHDHKIEQTSKLVGGDRYRCLARHCGAVFELQETAAPGADRRARESQARAAATRLAAALVAQRRKRQARLAFVTILAVVAVLLYLGSR